MTAPGSPPRSRRAVLGAAAGVVAGHAAPVASAEPPSAAAELTVATRNLGLGVDLDALLTVESESDLRRVAGELLETARAHPYDERVGAIADEVAATDPDVVALQEAAVVRTRAPGDDGETPEPAETVVDLLDRLSAALDERDLDYRVAGSTVTTDAELPADGEDGRVDVRVRDRDAVLVREDHETGGVRTGRYDTGVTVGLPGADRRVTLARGYCLVDVSLDAGTVTVASTHLESTAIPVRLGQALELRDALPSDGPVALGADLNSGPGTTTVAYDALTDRLADAYATLRPDADGYTCCQAESMRNGESLLEERADAVLYRAPLDPTAVERVGEDPDDRVDATVGGESVEVWPSDHAGVVATFELPPPEPTPSPTPTPTPTPSPTPAPALTPTSTPAATQDTETTAATQDTETTTSESGAGFGALATLACVLGGLWWRSRE